jgi:glycosyltransferase involved in cell wall biosynthesis
MEPKSEIVAFSQYKLGGVQNFYYNILSHCPRDIFDIKWIFEDVDDGDAKLPGLYGLTEEVIFKVDTGENETAFERAARLEKLVSDRPGVVLANFSYDLAAMHLHRKADKTIFFICHDEGYVSLAAEFEFLIDVFIAHNYQFYEEMVTAMPTRKEDIYFIPYGVALPEQVRIHDDEKPLRIVIAARMQVLKGVHDLPVIDDLLRSRNVPVEWTFIGEGPEKSKLEAVMASRGNAKFYAPATTKEVLELMRGNDIFILPSRLDGLPVAMLEAMSVGCVPVISEFNQGIKRVVTKDLGYIVPVGENNDFADCIERLHLNRAELKEKSGRVRAAIELDYNKQIQATKYVDLFKRFKELKKPYRRKLKRYGGWLEHPVVPKSVRPIIRTLRGYLFRTKRR